MAMLSQTAINFDGLIYLQVIGIACSDMQQLY